MQAWNLEANVIATIIYLRTEPLWLVCWEIVLCHALGIVPRNAEDMMRSYYIRRPPVHQPKVLRARVRGEVEL